MIPYDREELTITIINHGRTRIERCCCGWSVLGASHAEHVADEYEEAVVKKTKPMKPWWIDDEKEKS